MAVTGGKSGFARLRSPPGAANFVSPRPFLLGRAAGSARLSRAGSAGAVQAEHAPFVGHLRAQPHEETALAQELVRTAR